MELIVCHIKDIIAVLAAMGVVIDIVPVKVQPVRYVIRKIGSVMNESLIIEVQLLKKDFETHKIESQRYEILDFANSCMNSRKHTKEEFDHIVNVHDDYEKYINENNLSNGQVDIAFSFVKKINQKCMEENDFLKGE